MITQSEMKDALKRIRDTERDARIAAERGDNEKCYAALEKCQHAAFDAKALFQGVKLEPKDDFSLT